MSQSEMHQCEKILDDGERCSNPAVPGTRRCKKHGRILFRPVTEPSDTAPPPARGPSPEPPSAEPPPAPREPGNDLRAVPRAASEELSFAPLRFDERQLIVAPQGLVWLEADPAGPREEPFDRLARLLSHLSQTIDLAARARILIREPDPWSDSVVILTPHPEAEGAPSLFYDTVADAARLVGGRLYVGSENAFVQYRDDRAPRGYDAPGLVGDAHLRLVARWGSRALDPRELVELPLAELALRLLPLPSRRARREGVEVLHALAPLALYPLLARYLHAHRLRYRVGRWTQDDRDLVLIEISARATTRASPAVPAFVVEYLSRFPRLTLLERDAASEAAGEAAGPLCLVERGHRHPFRLAHLRGAFSEDELLIFAGPPHGNLRRQPGPTLFDGDLLSEPHLPRSDISAPLPATSADTAELTPVRLPLLLRRDPGPASPVAALLLDAREVGWLRHLLYRLPGHAFTSGSLYLGEDRAVLLAEDGGAFEDLPFGAPLRRHGSPHLFVPLGHRLLPEVPEPILRQALGLVEGVYTVLLQGQRLDLPAEGFEPLSRVLLADPASAAVTLRLRRSPLPELCWSAPPAPPVEIRRPGRKAAKQDRKAKTAEVDERAADHAVESRLRQRAREHEDAGDHLEAAICYSLLGDAVGRARCYRRLTDTLAEGS